MAHGPLIRGFDDLISVKNGFHDFEFLRELSPMVCYKGKLSNFVQIYED